MDFKNLYKYFRNIPVILTVLAALVTLVIGITVGVSIDTGLMCIIFFVGIVVCLITYLITGILISPLAICADAVLEKENEGEGEEDMTERPATEGGTTKEAPSEFAHTTCPHCKAKIRVRTRDLHSKIRCPFCQGIIDFSKE